MRGRLNVVTQETRFSLIQDILGHPAQLPTLKELPKDQRQNDLPYKFYGLSKDGRVFLEEHGLLRAEETLTEIYNTVDKTEAIERYETAPRPER